MSTDGFRDYEGMFLFDPTAGAEWDRVETQIKTLMSRAGAEMLACRRWDERRLAYPINGRKRGLYVLAYFRCSPDKIAGIERDAGLADTILRVLLIRKEQITEAQLKGEEPSASEILDRLRGSSSDRDRHDRRRESRRSRHDRDEARPQRVRSDEDAPDKPAEGAVDDSAAAPPTGEPPAQNQEVDGPAPTAEPNAETQQ